jgi:prepilin-type N-terminal cleavage/methylation domain-containing protein
MKCSPQRVRKAGLTLIEVMLAMAILGIGIFVLAEATSRCLAVIRVAKNHHTARFVLSRGELEHPIVWEEDEVVNVAVEPVEYQSGFTFSRSFAETDTEGLYEVHTRVSWSDRGGNAFEEVVGYLYCTNNLR